MTMRSHIGFRTSSYCGGGACVEVSPLEDGGVAVRDSTNPGQPTCRFTRDEWRDFILGVRAGEFDFDTLSQSAQAARAQ